MAQRLLSLCVGLFLAATCTAQSPVIEWQRTFGGGNDDQLRSLAPTNDGGYIVIGLTGSFDGDVTDNHGNEDCWVVKLDNTGSLQWQKALGGTGFDQAKFIIPTSDGGYIAVGFTTSADGDVTNNHGGGDYWVLKLDSTGTLQWEKTFGGSAFDVAYSIASTNDGGYIVAGNTESIDGDVTNNHGSGDYWVLKLDGMGNLQWQKTLGGSSYDKALSIIPTNNGDYIVAGTTYSYDGDVTNPHGDYDYWVVKLDGSGNLLWQKTLGGSGFDAASSIAPTNDGGYLVTGETGSTNGDVTNNHGPNDYWVVKLDGAGNLQWQKTLGGSYDERGYSIVPTSDGGFVVAGTAGSTDGDVTSNHGFYDAWLVKIDLLGSIQWQKAFGGSDWDAATSIAATNDGGYVTAGYTRSNDGDVTNNQDDFDFWVVKLGPESVGVDGHSIDAITCSPNPAKGSILVSTPKALRNARITLSDALGRKLLSATMNGTSHTLAVGDLLRGQYVVTLSSPEGRSAQRVVLE